MGRLGGSVGWATAFGSGHDPGVPGSSPTSGSLLSGESASPSDSLPSHALPHSLSGSELESVTKILITELCSQ